MFIQVLKFLLIDPISTSAEKSWKSTLHFRIKQSHGSVPVTHEAKIQRLAFVSLKSLRNQFETQTPANRQGKFLALRSL